MAVEDFFGAEAAWFVEYEDAPSKVLSAWWPGIPNYGDLTTINWNDVPPVDILTAGYPCQPFSQAGKRKGTDDERHLWPYIREAIRVLRPRFTLLENVSGHRSLGFSEVLAELAEDGFDVRWVSVRASEAGAPHQRDRVFIAVSDANAGGWDSWTGLRSRDPRWVRDRRPGDSGSETDWGKYEAAVRRWEAKLRPAPEPSEPSIRGLPQLAARFAEWILGLPDGHVTSLHSRRVALEIIGNGVCPQQAYHALSLLFEEELWVR